VIRDYADAKKLEWRPRRNATVARRIGRFEEAIRRNRITVSKNGGAAAVFSFQTWIDGEVTAFRP
jgi:hypothetical protein